MGTQIIINARSRQVSASLDTPGDGTTVFSVDLAGDTWHDFIYFMHKAKEYEREADFTSRNRYVRSAISNLFSHLDGIVCELYDMIRHIDPQFRQDDEVRSLKAKMFFISNHVTLRKKAKLPYVNTDLKLLRDILSHPSITKEQSNKSTRETILYDSADVYGVSVSDLSSTGSLIDAWLNRACKLYGYQRFCDTEELCNKVVQAIGGAISETNTF